MAPFVIMQKHRKAAPPISYGRSAEALTARGRGTTPADKRQATITQISGIRSLFPTAFFSSSLREERPPRLITD